jgi:hypothetical protein
LLHIAVTTLLTEGVLVTANGGDCPLGGLQSRVGDPVPLFELVLSPPAAKRAVPTLGTVTAVGFALLVARGRWGSGTVSTSPTRARRRSRDAGGAKDAERLGVSRDRQPVVP